MFYQDVSASALSLLLQFLYTGELPAWEGRGLGGGGGGGAGGSGGGGGAGGRRGAGGKGGKKGAGCKKGDKGSCIPDLKSRPEYSLFAASKPRYAANC